MNNSFSFSKFHAAGNDFVVVDAFSKDKSNMVLNSTFLQKVCHRQMGVGADGIVVLRSWDELSSTLCIDLYNSDGGVATMCANGTRCAMAFLQKMFNWKSRELVVKTLSGNYQGKISQNTIWLSVESSYIKNQEYDLSKVDTQFSFSRFYFANSGVPHSIFWVKDVQSLAIEKIAPAIRSNAIFPEGCNVNFLTQISDHEYQVRTFERGVEGETLSCGTGILAISSMLKNRDKIQGEVIFHTPGGILKAHISSEKISYGGEVVLVYSAILEDAFYDASR